MNRQPLVVVDTDAIIAQADPEDGLHKRAVLVAEKLLELDAKILTPATTVLEAVTYMQRVLNSTATACGTAEFYSDPNISVIPVNQETISMATSKYMNPRSSKKNTLFDCVVAIIAEEYEADAIFSFDTFYKKKGFKLAEEL